MSVIGTLAVNIVAKTEKFTSGIGKAAMSMDRFSSATMRATKVTAAFGAATAAAAAGGLAALTKSQFSAIDTLAKTSDKLGISIEKLTSLRLAAEETGVSAGTLDTALQRMVRRIAEAGNGMGEAQGALKELGLNARIMARLAPEDQFDRIAGAMAKVGTQGDRVRLAMKLFDSEGVSLVNTLKLGSAGLREYEAVAERLGLTVSRKLAAAVERANDAVGRLKMAFVGLGRQLAVRVAPVIENASKWMEKLLTDDGRIGKFADAIARGLGFAIEVVLRGVREIKRQFLETSVLVRTTLSEMMANPLVVDRLQRMGMSDKTMADMVSANNYHLLRSENSLFKMGLDDKNGATMADKFGKWFSGVLDAANASPAMERSKSGVVDMFGSMFDRIGEQAKQATGFLDRLSGVGKKLEQMQLDQALHDITFGAFGKNFRMAGGAAESAMQSRGSLAFAQSGSVESYRQQASIRRQNEPLVKLGQRQLQVQEQIRDELKNQPRLAAANL